MTPRCLGRPARAAVLLLFFAGPSAGPAAAGTACRVLLGDAELAGVETADGWVVVRTADRWDGWRVRVEP